FARHHARVLLIDCDLRRGTQAKFLGIVSVDGVSTVLTQGLALDDAIEAVPGVDNLSVLPCGPRSPDPAVLTASPEMARLIGDCAGKYDFVFLDSAPSLGISDTVNLGRLADVVVLVVREGHSNRRSVREAHRRTSAARLPVIGFVLNDV